jgi:hypothetical protein
VLCLTSCCSVLLQDLNRVFPIGSGLDDLYSLLSLVVDFVPSCALTLLVFQFHRLHWISCRASRPSVLASTLRCLISVPARFTVRLLPSIFAITVSRSPLYVRRPQDPFLIFFYQFSFSVLPLYFVSLCVHSTARPGLRSLQSGRPADFPACMHAISRITPAGLACGFVCPSRFSPLLKLLAFLLLCAGKITEAEPFSTNFCSTVCECLQVDAGIALESPDQKT